MFSQRFVLRLTCLRVGMLTFWLSNITLGKFCSPGILTGVYSCVGWKKVDNGLADIGCSQETAAPIHDRVKDSSKALSSATSSTRNQSTPISKSSEALLSATTTSQTKSESKHPNMSLFTQYENWQDRENSLWSARGELREFYIFKAVLSWILKSINLESSSSNSSLLLISSQLEISIREFPPLSNVLSLF